LTLGDPRGALRLLSSLLGWLYRPVGCFVWLLVLLVGVVRFLVDQDRIVENPAAVIAPNNWLWLAMAGAFCKIVHEISHGLCSMHYGGTVKSWGFNLVLFFPMPFVDASSIWRLPSKWKRIHVAFAGVYAEFLLAAIAAIVHSWSNDDLVRLICLNMMITGGLLSLLVNLNPFLRYDGYFILSDFLEIPNLGPVASDHLQSCMKWFFCGVQRGLSHSLVVSLGFVAYGSMCFACRVSISIMMVLAAHRMFAGVGLVFATTATIVWFCVPIVRGLRYVAVGNVNEYPSRLRFVSIVLAIASVGWMGATKIYVPERIEIAGVVDFVPGETVRCQVDGFVSRIDVMSGSHVQKGDILLVLSNPNISFDLEALQIERKQLECRRQVLQTVGDIATIHALDGAIQSLNAKQREKKEQLETLIIQAPCDGVVIATDFENLPGRFLSIGDIVCVVGDPKELGIRLMIPQCDIDDVSEICGRTGELRFEGKWEQAFSGTLASIEPRATSELIHPAFAASAGGPLAVRPISAKSESESIVLAEPHFVATAEMPSDLRSQCASGQRVSYRFVCHRDTMYQKVTKYFAHAFQQVE
jgi:putative peptide zinc metalloprotease protein